MNEKKVKNLIITLIVIVGLLVVLTIEMQRLAQEIIELIRTICG